MYSPSVFYVFTHHKKLYSLSIKFVFAQNYIKRPHTTPSHTSPSDSILILSADSTAWSRIFLCPAENLYSTNYYTLHMKLTDAIKTAGLYKFVFYNINIVWQTQTSRSLQRLFCAISVHWAERGLKIGGCSSRV
jgi:hypothetical protein